MYVKTFPHVNEAAVSPVWRIHGRVSYNRLSACDGGILFYVTRSEFDPHRNTPVEILHVILLGFVKYLWRDTVARLKDAEKATLIARLSSFDVSGLGVPPLTGKTLVTYAKSLVGCDFRVVAQAAPFALHGLDSISDELVRVWTALSRLIPLVWHLSSHLIRFRLLRVDSFMN